MPWASSLVNFECIDIGEGFQLVLDSKIEMLRARDEKVKSDAEHRWKEEAARRRRSGRGSTSMERGLGARRQR